jgi:hypothetical protein
MLLNGFEKTSRLHRDFFFLGTFLPAKPFSIYVQVPMLASV